jgi:hypothetical protein
LNDHLPLESVIMFDLNALVDFGEALAEIPRSSARSTSLRWTYRTATPDFCEPIRRRLPKT